MSFNVAAWLLARPHGADPSVAGALVGGVVLIIFLIAFFFVWLVFGFLLSRIFVKANKPGIAGFIPIWNLIVILEMVQKPVWWVLLFLIPGLNFFMVVYVKALLLERFGVESPMSFILAIVGFFFPVVTFALLVWGAFGDVAYRAPNTFGAATPAY